MLPTRQIIPALPGFYAIFPEKENGTFSIHKEPIIAWAFDTCVMRREWGQPPFEEYLDTVVYPLTTDPAGDIEIRYVLEPGGCVRSFDCYFQSLEEFILHLERDEKRMKAKERIAD